MILYGFRSCDMVRNAMRWLDAHQLTYTFVDYRKTLLAAATIDDWFARAGWEVVFNRNSASWKRLAEAEQVAITPARARALILDDTNFIKRPLLDTGSRLMVGFNASEWETAGLG